MNLKSNKKGKILTGRIKSMKPSSLDSVDEEEWRERRGESVVLRRGARPLGCANGKSDDVDFESSE